MLKKLVLISTFLLSPMVAMESDGLQDIPTDRLRECISVFRMMIDAGAETERVTSNLINMSSGERRTELTLQLSEMLNKRSDAQQQLMQLKAELERRSETRAR